MEIIIDDIFALTLAGQTLTTSSAERAILLTIKVTARPLDKNKLILIPRSEMASKNKLLAEALAEAIKMILELLVDLCRFSTISLLDNKFIAWSDSL